MYRGAVPVPLLADGCRLRPVAWKKETSGIRHTFVYDCSPGRVGVDLEFAWDEEKARINLAKHRVSFLTAAEIFTHEIMERIDDREDYGEVRWIALGGADMEVFRVVYTWRGDGLIRIISVMKASRDERDIDHRATLP